MELKAYGHRDVMVIKNIKRLFIRWKNSNNIKHDLDVLLESANPNEDLELRLSWLVNLVEWIRYSSTVDYKEIENVKAPSLRIKFLVQILERNPKWKSRVAKTLRSIIRDTSCTEIFSEIGLPEEYSLFSEFSSRLFAKVLPSKPLSEGMGVLFSALFPSQYDIDWLSSLDPDLMAKMVDLFFYDEEESEKNWNDLRYDIEESIYCLASDVKARALSPQIRKRLGFDNIKENPFFGLTKNTDEVFFIDQSDNFDAFVMRAKDYRKDLLKCIHSISNIYHHLNVHGVNVAIVYQLETMQSKLKRIDDLISFLMFKKLDPEMLIYFFTLLAEENQNRKSLRALFNQNTELLARKIVDRSAETGEHYITRTRAEYKEMFKKAAGGGAYTAVTVYLKYLFYSFNISGFFEGVLYSINYAVSFTAIQLSGFTLATKQPAMTAPALASKLQYLDKGESVEIFVDEVVHLIRTQVVGIIGNVGVVVPTVLVIDLFSYFVFGSHLLSEEKAHQTLRSTNIFGMTVFFAAFTGTLLWASSIFAGWMDNWFYFNNMKQTIIYNRKFNYIFGKQFCLKVAGFLEKNISALAGNISLGFLLGLFPEVLSFFGFPLEVRHVTLSSGSLAAALPILGFEVFKTKELYFAVIGIVFIAVLNVGVSFMLALIVAIKSRKIKAQHRSYIFHAMWKRFKTKPMSFVYPALNASKHSDQDGSKTHS